MYFLHGKLNKGGSELNKDDKFYKSFSQEEYNLHITKLQNQMKEDNIDALLLSMPENVYYATGYKTWYSSSLFRPVFCVLGQTGEPYIILRVLEKTTVQLYSWTKNILCWGTPTRKLGELQAETVIDALRIVFKEHLNGVKNVGLEAGDGLHYYSSLTLLKDIIDEFNDIDFIDGSLTIQKARMVKTKWELDRIREACKATEDAIVETGMEIVAGVTTEKDVSRGIAKRMAEKGIDKFSYLTVISGNPKYSTFNAYSTDRVIQKDDVVLVDISGHIDGYASDLTRVFYIGKPSEEIINMAQVSFDSVLSGAKALKPGVTVGEINKVCEDYIKNTKYKDYVVHSSGHGIGLNVVEHPMIQDGGETPLEEGMVFAIEQGVYPYDPSVGAESINLCIRYEDQIAVTKDGYEYISGPGKPLYIVEGK